MRNDYPNQDAISETLSPASSLDCSPFPDGVDYVTSDDGEITFYAEHGSTVWVDPSFGFDPENIEEVESSR